MEKKTYTIKLTEVQLLWLDELLDRGLDGYFENNPDSRLQRKRIEEKIKRSLINQ